MSLALSMKSWCENFTNNYIDRKNVINKVRKSSHHVVKQYNEFRIKMGAETRDLLKEKYFENKRQVFNLIKRYITDRGEAGEILSNMRGKPLKPHKEFKHGH